MVRSETEIKQELEKWKNHLLQCRQSRQYIEASFAATIVSALSYVLGIVDSATTRVKVE